jgi:hypothetical protein
VASGVDTALALVYFWRMAAFLFDETRWPLLKVVIPARYSQEDVVRYLADYQAILDRKKAFALLVDTTATTQQFNALQRRLQADFLLANDALCRKYLRAMGFAIPSLLVRGAAQAVFWIAPPPMPYKFLPTLPEAIAWCNAMLSAEGLGARASLGCCDEWLGRCGRVAAAGERGSAPAPPAGLSTVVVLWPFYGTACG